jgi:hypothetical protein
VIFGSEPDNPIIVYGPLGCHCRGALCRGGKGGSRILAEHRGYLFWGLFLRGYKAVVRPFTPMF